MTAEAFNKIAGGLKEAIAGGTAPEIARRLSRAQRDALYPGPGNPEYAGGYPGSLAVLKRLGLVSYTYQHTSGRTHGGRLTLLGSAVRSIIEQEGGK